MNVDLGADLTSRSCVFLGADLLYPYAPICVDLDTDLLCRTVVDSRVVRPLPYVRQLIEPFTTQVVWWRRGGGTLTS